ncbi:MAG: response regulator transcription factor [Pseudomonadota bacterium]
MNFKILIVEDEECILRGLKDAFSSMGFEVEAASTGKEAVSKAESFKPHIMILDVMLPCYDGFEVCRKMGKANFPIVMLTAKNTDMDKVTGFELGIEDYVTKPFSIIELVARVKAILKRHYENKEELGIIKIGDVEIDFNKFEVKKNNASPELSPKCFELLKYLYENAGNAVSRFDLMDKVWGMDKDLNTRTIDNHIVRLRNLIEKDPKNPEILLTIHGIGYKLKLGKN